MIAVRHITVFLPVNLLLNVYHLPARFYSLIVLLNVAAINRQVVIAYSDIIVFLPVNLFPNV